MPTRRRRESSSSGSPEAGTPLKTPIRPQLIIFDFDGTLADCLYLSYEIINSLAPEFGHREITEEEMQELRNHGARHIIKVMGISKLKVPFLMDRCRREYRRRLKEVQPFAGLQPVLAGLKARGYQLGIVTSNAEENVREFLGTFGLEYFDFVHGKSSIWGKKKDLRKLLKKMKLAPTDVVYVGDELRDIEAAQANSIPIISVGWGFNTASALRRKGADVLVETVDQLDGVFV
jgi:phosphoglycolate phosphatase